MAPPGYLVSVETETGGIGVVFDHGHGSIAYSHGHQSHHVDRTAVAVLAPRAGGKGVAVMRSFTGGVQPVSDLGRTERHPPSAQRRCEGQ